MHFALAKTLTIGLAVWLTTTIGLPVPSSAQEKGNKDKTELTPANIGKSGEEKGKTGDAPKVTYENGVKIVGEKTFDAAIKNGIPYIDGEEYEIDTTVVKGIGSMQLLKDLDKNEKLQYIRFSNFGDEKRIAYFIYESGIFSISKDNEGGVQFRGVIAKDGSKMFLHDAAVFLAKNGSIVATTPTTLLIITPKEAWGIAYEKLLKTKLPPLERPYISKGGTDDYVHIGDPTIKDGQQMYKIEVRLSDFEVTVNKSVPPETLLWRERADSTHPARIDSTVRVPIH